MADKIEFISAAELPEAEVEDIDILCVDNGELKKKSGANLGVRSWNQLEDRPFYDESIVIVPETAVTSHPDGAPIGLYSDLIKAGTTCLVSFDGTDYECVAYELEGPIVIGSGNVVGLEGGNGEPFLIGTSPEMGMQLFTNDETDVTISVKIPNIKTIDTKYLPEALQVYETEGNVLFDETVTLEDGGYYRFPELLPLEDKKEYKVTIDGVEYNTTAYMESPDVWLIPVPEINGESFYIYGYNIMFNNNGGSTHTLKIVEADSIKVKQFDKKFIPGLPYCVEVYSHGNNEYTCDLSYYDIYKIIETGTLVYAVIKFENIINGGWVLNASYGYYYFNQYSMPDDDILNFVSPDGRRYITFFGGGSIAVGSN